MSSSMFHFLSPLKARTHIRVRFVNNERVFRLALMKANYCNSGGESSTVIRDAHVFVRPRALHTFYIHLLFFIYIFVCVRECVCMNLRTARARKCVCACVLTE